MTDSEIRTILIVEDEQDLAHLCSDYLQHANYNTHCIADGALVVDWIKNNEVDLVLLDLMLPHKDGLDIFRELRTFTQVPIIMATAKVEEIDRLIGLELGADDYICKPYSPREMVIRVKNVLRRTYAQPPQTQNQQETALDRSTNERLVVNKDLMQAKIDGKALDLTPAEFRLLNFLSTHPFRIYSRDQLIAEIYDDYRVVTDRTIDSHIKNLRKKINSLDPNIDCIKSVYGVGYKFEFE